jgi:hypothetical protein
MLAEYPSVYGRKPSTLTCTPVVTPMTLADVVAGCWTFDGLKSGTLPLELEPPVPVSSQFTIQLQMTGTIPTSLDLGSSTKQWIITSSSLTNDPFSGAVNGAQIVGNVTDNSSANHSFTMTITTADHKLSCNVMASAVIVESPDGIVSGSDEGVWTAHDGN